MILPDINILVYAHRTESRDHGAYREWLEGLVNGDQAYGIFDEVVAASFGSLHIRGSTGSRARLMRH